MPRSRSISADDVLAALVSGIEQTGYVPTRRELAATFGFASHSALTRYFIELRDAGRIEWQPGRYGTLRVLSGDDPGSRSRF